MLSSFRKKYERADVNKICEMLNVYEKKLLAARQPNVDPVATCFRSTIIFASGRRIKTSGSSIIETKASAIEKKYLTGHDYED